MGLFDNVNKAVETQKDVNAGDLSSQNIKMKVVTEESNLNIRKGPGTEYDIVGKAAHDATVQLLRKDDEKWYYIKTDDGIEGFCAQNFLQQV